MEKLKILSFLTFLLVPGSLWADDPRESVLNTYSFSSKLNSSNDVAWQIFNSSTNNKTVYVGPVDLSTHGEEFFTFRSSATDAGTPFTGTLTSVTPVPTNTNVGNVAVSSATTSTNASAPTGDIVWQGIVKSSDTYRAFNQWKFAVPPGTVLYLIKANSGASEDSSATFFFREEN